MSKTSFLFCLIFSSTILSQTLFFEENFDYSEGELTTLSTDWNESPTGSVPIQIVSGNLSYTDYPSSGIGNKIVVDGGVLRSGVNHSLITQSIDGSNVYCSFLVNIISTNDMDINTSEGDYFFNFQNSGETVTKANISVRQGSNSSTFSIGLEKASSSSLTWYTNELDVGSTYLVVVAYSFIIGSGNDEVKLWINPDLSGSEPTADINITDGTDAADIAFVQFRQRLDSGDEEIDGLRVADSWSFAPLPVELSFFSAIIINDVIKLNWHTETEVNNYGFEVQCAKSNDQSTIWNVLGFVEGSGNSNSPKKYSFVDNSVSNGNLYYRLKQIDNDGKFEYSKVIEVNAVLPGRFELYQNYPNPFNPLTTIKFSLPENDNVKLTVFNLLGEKVAVLVDEFKEAGSYTVDFDASEFQSGIYFYEMETSYTKSVKKMILLK